MLTLVQIKVLQLLVDLASKDHSLSDRSTLKSKKQIGNLYNKCACVYRWKGCNIYNKQTMYYYVEFYAEF